MSRGAEIRRVVGKRYWREVDARVVVAAWEGSGETAAAFARRQEVNPRRLAWWRSRLEATGPAAQLRFHAVRLAGTGRVEGRDRGAIEIELCGGRRVRLRPGFEAEDLRRVMAVLEETGC